LSFRSFMQRRSIIRLIFIYVHPHLFLPPQALPPLLYPHDHLGSWGLGRYLPLPKPPGDQKQSRRSRGTSCLLPPTRLHHHDPQFLPVHQSLCQPRDPPHRWLPNYHHHLWHHSFRPKLHSQPQYNSRHA